MNSGHVSVSSFSRYDLFPKFTESYDTRAQTPLGGLISVMALVIMGFLFFSEFYAYLRPEPTTQILVDNEGGQDKLLVNFDIIFDRLPCDIISVDVMDMTGSHLLDIHNHDIYRRRLDRQGNPILLSSSRTSKDGVEKVDIAALRKEFGGKIIADLERVNKLKAAGTYCGSCYGTAPDGECCNDCSKVLDLYKDKGWEFKLDDFEQCAQEALSQKLEFAHDEGCHIYGNFEIKKLAGNFHFAPGKSLSVSRMHVHNFKDLSGKTFNTSHRINHLSFGKTIPYMRFPLDRSVVTTDDDNVMMEYFLKLVPTQYIDSWGGKIETNQFSVTKFQKPINSHTSGLPGVFFIYDYNPFIIRYSERHQTFAHFVVELFAILGGIYTVFGLIDRFLFTSVRAFRRKAGLGKIN